MTSNGTITTTVITIGHMTRSLLEPHRGHAKG